MQTTQVLSSLLVDAAQTSKDKTLEGGWRGAEAFHFYLLAQRQLYEVYLFLFFSFSLFFSLFLFLFFSFSLFLFG